MHAAVAATPAFAFHTVTALLDCCAVTESGTANATKNIVFVMHVNFLDFMAAS
jgi:hypothetical protein